MFCCKKRKARKAAKAQAVVSSLAAVESSLEGKTAEPPPTTRLAPLRTPGRTPKHSSVSSTYQASTAALRKSIRRAAVSRVRDIRGCAAMFACDAASVLRRSGIPDMQRTPCLSTWGSRFKNKPATTYSPTPTKVQYHRREES